MPGRTASKNSTPLDPNSDKVIAIIEQMAALNPGANDDHKLQALEFSYQLMVEKVRQGGTTMQDLSYMARVLYFIRDKSEVEAENRKLRAETEKALNALEKKQIALEADNEALRANLAAKEAELLGIQQGDVMVD